MIITIEHRDIQEAGLHEPKGASTATSGTVYVASGSGSGSWDAVPADASGISIERLLDAVSLAATQNPTGLGDANAVTIEFGAAQLTASDPVSLDVDGTLHVNTTGLYRVKIALQFGRVGSASVSELLFRALVDGVQAGRSIAAKVDSADTDIYFENDSWLNLTAGQEITYEVMRDASGNDSGGLIQIVPTGSWEDSPTASLRVERWA